MQDVTTPTQGSRATIWAYTLATMVLAPLLNFLIGIVTSIDLASFTLYTFIPVGTFALCAVACSGFIFGAKESIYMPDVVDLVFLMAASVGAIVLTYLVEYVFQIVWYHASTQQLGTFGRFVATSITSAEYTTYSKPYGLEGSIRAGEGGFLVAFVRIPAAAAIAKIVHSTMASRAINMS